MRATILKPSANRNPSISVSRRRSPLLQAAPMHKTQGYEIDVRSFLNNWSQIKNIPKSRQPQYPLRIGN
ncbi:MAG: hypothetical protein KME27_03090 [Lyngbya sp. HA4199-MV5]|nr:hypothetical protein [Lyngbya sp. HA4199-MV5]